jgi:hypothetical protein
LKTKELERKIKNCAFRWCIKEQPLGLPGKEKSTQSERHREIFGQESEIQYRESAAEERNPSKLSITQEKVPGFGQWSWWGTGNNPTRLFSIEIP